MKVRRIRSFLIAGLAVMVPVAGTWYLLAFLFAMADGVIRPLVVGVLGRYYPGLGVLVALVVLLATGALATHYLGRRLIAGVEAVILRAPMVRGVYLAFKQVVEAFTNAAAAPFDRVVLVEYPRRGLYAVGFVTGRPWVEVEGAAGDEVATVFIPTTPNPTSGFLAMVPRSQLIKLDMTVEEGVKLVVTGGTVVPQGRQKVVMPCLPKES